MVETETDPTSRKPSLALVCGSRLASRTSRWATSSRRAGAESTSRRAATRPSQSARCSASADGPRWALQTYFTRTSRPNGSGAQWSACNRVATRTAPGSCGTERATTRSASGSKIWCCASVSTMLTSRR
eukprot:5502436-Prymnesium_polylepis.2